MNEVEGDLVLVTIESLRDELKVIYETISKLDADIKFHKARLMDAKREVFEVNKKLIELSK